MKNIYIVVAMSFVITGAMVSQSFSEKIHLKDGRVVEEQIVERSSYYIKTMDGKKPNKYFMDQIERIEEDEAENPDVKKYIDLSQYRDMGEEKAKLIFNYIDVSGVRTAMNENVQLTIDQVPEDEKEKYRRLFNVDEILKRLVPVYAKYYSEVDLINMIQFYESPTGQTLLETTPEIVKETVDITIQYIQEQAAP